MMSLRQFQPALVVLLAALASGTLTETAAWSQASDDVHLTPKNAPGEDAAVMTPDLLLHARPLRSDVDLVLVPVTVTDASNHPVLDLRREDFSITENSEAQQIRYFSHEDGPISVAFVLDCSASMTNKIEYEGLALEEFLNNANSDDEYFAVTVSSKPHLIASSSDSIGTLEGRLAATTPQGRTALYDAMYLAMSELRTARYQRRALLIISDGGDNTSRYTRKQIKSLIEESDVLIYAIGIFDEEPIPLLKSIEERMGRDWLSELTDVSGGKAIAADDRRQIPQIAALVSRELRSQYVLGYRPTNSSRDGRWRRIRVTTAPASAPYHLQLHYREGYKAPTQ